MPRYDLHYQIVQPPQDNDPVPLPPPQPVDNSVTLQNNPNQSQAERLKVPPRIYSGLPESQDYMKLDAGRLASTW